MSYSSKSRVPHKIFTRTTNSICNVYFITFLLLQCNGVATAEEHGQKIIGAIINVNTRMGREEKISMEIAVQAFNNISSNKNKLSLHVIDSGGKPLQALMKANDLIKEKHVQAIIGMETWPEAVLVAEVASSAQVPILSYAAPSFTPPLTSVLWPFLVTMANNDSLQMQCVASIVGSYGWRRVIAIYEKDGYSTDSGMITLLSDALQDVGSEIEARLAFPPFSTLSNPKDFIQDELKRKLNSTQSRVFIIVGSSLELATNILVEAKYMGLFGKDSVWITTDSVTNLLHTVNSSIMSSMKGILGIKTHFSEVNPSFLSFSTNFRNAFHSAYPEEDKSEPGYYALRAYDAISTVALALEKTTNNSSTTVSRKLLENILSTNFNGLTGRVQFNDGELSRSTTYAIVNVIGRTDIRLKLWSQEYGFSENVTKEISTQEKNKSGGGNLQVLGVPVYWPGKLDRVPLGWVTPNDVKPFVIGVPGGAFPTFVKVENGKDPTGFCIDIFDHAIKLLNYDLPHKFVPFYGHYDDLVDSVYFKRYDAVVGDITILANRSKYVDFTQPYAESWLTMVVPVKSEEKTWLFLKPFTGTLWIVSGIVFVYTMLIVWFLEHRSNPDFSGPLRNQLSTAMWFTFSTIFFAHRENLRSNFTRIVMFVWLLSVFILTSSYTASLTSMLTVQRLKPTVTDFETLKRTNSPVGCDGISFLRKYIEKVLDFHPNNIVHMSLNPDDYRDAFKNGTIAAAFFEQPYERVFLSLNPKGYKDSGLKHRFGGLGFVFPKASPMTRDFSEAFLRLSEDGTLNKIDQYWFPSSSQDSNTEGDTDNQRLDLSNFWGLFLVTGITSTIILILYIVHLHTRSRHSPAASIGTADDSVWNGIKRLGAYYNTTRLHQSRRDPVSTNIRDDGVSLSVYNTPTDAQATSVRGSEMPETYIRVSNNQRRVTRLSTFPGPGRRIRTQIALNKNSASGHSPPMYA